VLLVDHSLHEADRRFFVDIGRAAALGTVMVLLTIAALAWLLHRLVHRPLKEVAATSRRIVGGNLNARAQVPARGEFALLAGHVNQMTDHLANSLEAEESHRRELSDILNAVDDEIVVVDRDHRVAIANDAFQSRSAPDADTIIGRSCSDVPAIHWPCTADRPEGCSVNNVFRTGRGDKGIVTQAGPDGTERSIEIHASPMFSPDGEVHRVVEVRRDISERRQLEASLVHSERLASVGLLASRVSHEINNPLGVIAVSVDGLQRWLDRQEDLSEELRKVLGESLTRIVEETRRGRSVTDRLLHIARPAARSRSLIDVNRAVDETLATMAFAVQRAGVEARKEFAEGLPPLVGDEANLKQVLMNLLLNSIQAMDSRGGTLRVVTSHDGGELRIDVEDTGEGIPAALLTRIYDPFFTTKPAGEGTGLGLFIAHRLITDMGGAIRVESRPGDGTRFTLTFPAPEKEG
jgi:PAS domain S-box-containing protein